MHRDRLFWCADSSRFLAERVAVSTVVSLAQSETSLAFRQLLSAGQRVAFDAKSVTAKRLRYFSSLTAFRCQGAGGAGLANLAASIETFGCISVNSKVSTPDSHVTVQRNGNFTPATSR